MNAFKGGPARRSGDKCDFLIGLLISILALAGLGAHAWFEIRRTMHLGRGASIDDRYRAAIEALPGGQESVGYLSDLPLNSANEKESRSQAQYALAPRLVVPGAERAYVLVDPSNPKAIAGLCARYRLEPLVTTHQIALARRVARR